MRAGCVAAKGECMLMKMIGRLRQADLDARTGRVKPACGQSVHVCFVECVRNYDIANAMKRSGYCEFIGKYDTVLGEHFHVYAIHERRKAESK